MRMILGIPALVAAIGCSPDLDRTVPLDLTVVGQGSLSADFEPGSCPGSCHLLHHRSLIDDKGHDVCALPAAGWRLDHFEGDCAQGTTPAFTPTAPEQCTHLSLQEPSRCVAVFVPARQP